MLTALLIFTVTLILVIWQPRGLGIGWSASLGAGIALLTGVVQVGDIAITLVHTPGHTPGSQCFHVGH